MGGGLTTPGGRGQQVPRIAHEGKRERPLAARTGNGGAGKGLFVYSRVSSAVHQPVLLDAALEALAIEPDGAYCDATYGRGGHAQAMLARLGERGRLLVIDKDPQAVAAAREQMGSDPRCRVWRGSFAALEQAAAEAGIVDGLNGILMDLGVSSPQLDDAARGFSFARLGPLDMRMDPDAGPSAAQWLAGASEKEIADVLWRYGEERFSRRIARAVVAARRNRPLETTAELAELIAHAVPTREAGKDPATRSFQAIRIHLNRELDDLESGLEAAARLLVSGGRLAVISFHSLEDRIVKRFIRANSQTAGSRRRPAATGTARLRKIAGPLRPSAAEIERNPRARSAVLRVAERR